MAKLAPMSRVNRYLGISEVGDSECSPWSPAGRRMTLAGF